jgi:dephospho-CoA kinase
LRVGLTGGIACGKSYVLRRLAAAGLGALDLDAVAHEVMAAGGAAHADVVNEFGSGILAADGGVDRKRLGDLVFADPNARARLNALVHPRVRAEEARRAAAADRGPGTVVVTDAALLVEAGVHLRFHRLVVVHCPPELQRRRLQERDAIDDAAAEARLAAQMPIEEKRRFAHFEVDTSGSFADTDRQADALAGTLRDLARTVPAPVPVPLDRAAACLLLGPRDGPRGLAPLKALAEIVAAGGPETERLARVLVPPVPGPWYRAAAAAPGPGPATLAGPVALWSLARAGADDEHVAAAAATFARLTHSNPAARTDAVLQALLLQSAAVAGVVDDRLSSRHGMSIPLAERWGGARPTGRVREALRSALRHPQDASRAREDAQDPETGGLAAALVGIAAGSPSTAIPPDLLASLRQLNARAAD